MAMSLVKAAVIRELKSMAQIDRMTAKMQQPILNDRKSALEALRLKHRTLQETIDGGIDHFQRYFLAK